MQHGGTCQRCSARDQTQLSLVLDRLVCARCVKQLVVWLRPRRHHVSAGERIAQVTEIVAERGCVTARSLAKRTGRARNHATAVLIGMHKAGHLERVAEGVYRLASDTDRTAERAALRRAVNTPLCPHEPGEESAAE